MEQDSRGEEGSNRSIPQVVTVQDLLRALREKDQIIAQQSAQIAALTSKVDSLIEHIKKMNSDNSSRRTSKKRQIKEDFPALKKPATMHNRFEVLDTEDTQDDMDQSTPEENSQEKQNSDDEESSRPGRSNSDGNPTKTRKFHEQSAHEAEPPKDDSSENTKIPPIVIRQKDKWDSVADYFDKNEILWSRVKNINLGIKVFFSDITSYRSATKYLDRQKIAYYTFTPPDEKTLRVVIRGVTEHYTEDDIKEDLETKGHAPIKVARMKNSDKKPLPLALVILPREEKNIYKLQYVKRFSVTVEPQRPKATIGQCHRCQQFGHAQSRCTAPPKCVKCAGNHLTSECHKPANTPAKCINCGGPHPASYRGCTKFPTRQEQPAKKATEQIRYSDAVKATTYSQANNMDALNAVKAIQSLLLQITQIAKQITPIQST